MIISFSNFNNINESEDNRIFKYEEGDFLIVEYTMWNISKRIKNKIPILVYVTYISKIDKHSKMYMGQIIPKKEDDNEIHFNEDDVIKKLTLDDVEMYLNVNKFNL